MSILNITSLLHLPGTNPDNDVVLRRAKTLKGLGFNIKLLRPVRWPPPLLHWVTRQWRAAHKNYKKGVVTQEGEEVIICSVCDINPPHLMRKYWHLQTPPAIKNYCCRHFRLRARGDELLNLLKPTVIQSEYIYPDSIIGAVLARRYGARHIICVREMEYPALLMNAGVIRHLNAADIVISPSKVIIERAISRGVRKATAIPHYAEDRFFEASNNYPSGPVCFVSICRLLDLKNLHLVLESLALVKDIEWTYSIVGAGPELERLKELASKFNISRKVTFCGAIRNEEIPEAFSAFDCLVMPSKFEAFGIAYAEALAMGLAIVGVAGGGIAGYMKNTPGVYYVSTISDVQHVIMDICQNIGTIRGTRGVRRDAAAIFRKSRVIGTYAALYEKKS